MAPAQLTRTRLQPGYRRRVYRTVSGTRIDLHRFITTLPTRHVPFILKPSSVLLVAVSLFLSHLPLSMLLVSVNVMLQNAGILSQTFCTLLPGATPVMGRHPIDVCLSRCHLLAFKEKRPRGWEVCLPVATLCTNTEDAFNKYFQEPTHRILASNLVSAVKMYRYQCHKASLL